MSDLLHQYYKELNIPFGAPTAVARRAFLRIARQSHPDKCKAPGAADRFRQARSAFEGILASGIGSTGIDFPDFEDDGSEDDWKPPSKRPRARTPSPEPTEPEPILCLSELLELVLKGRQGVSENALRRRFLQAGLLWPWGSAGDEHGLNNALLRLLRDQLDKRVTAKDWSSLTKKDLVWWLDARGLCLKYAMEDDSVSKDAVVRLVQGHLKKIETQQATPIEGLQLQLAKMAEEASKPGGAEDIASATLSKISSQSTDVIAKPFVLTATVSDYRKWLQHSIQQRRGQEGMKVLLQMAQEGSLFRGKRLELKPLRAVIRQLGL